MVKYNKTHEAVFAGIANEVTGKVNEKYNDVEYYFNLKETNRQLVEENNALRNQLLLNFENPDTSKVTAFDSTRIDTIGKLRKFIWLPAKVVNNSVSTQSNYLSIFRGSNQGVKKGMAVIGPQGIVGTVVNTSSNHAVVMSLLHRNSSVSSMLKKDFSAGKVEWDGKNPEYVTLRNILKSSKVAKGDTVLTSNYSSNFPPGIMIGTVAEIVNEPASNSFIIKVKTATKFSSLQYVYLVENMQYAEQKQLEAQTIKPNE